MWATSVLLVLMLSVGMTAVQAASNSQLEARIEKLERMLESRGLLGLLDQVESLQREIQQLRGEVELQNYNLESTTGRQRELYLDIDRRLHRLEVGDQQGDSAIPATPGPAESSAVLPPAGHKPAAVQQAPGSPDERKDYDHALSLLRDGRYTDAATAFQAFLQKYPQSEYADNAQYWLGEVHYVSRQFPQALEAFGRIQRDYADSTKSGDALLKTGYIHYELKDWSKARATLSQVVKEYPGSTAARLAEERLERMKREGH